MKNILNIIFKNKPIYIDYLLKFLNEDVVKIIISFYVNCDLNYYVPVKYQCKNVELDIDYIYSLRLYMRIDKNSKCHDDVLLYENNNTNKNLLENFKIEYEKTDEKYIMLYLLISTSDLLMEK